MTAPDSTTSPTSSRSDPGNLRRPRRAVTALAVAGAAASALGLGALLPAGAATASDGLTARQAATNPPSCGGSWRYEVAEGPGDTLHGLITFHADGTVLFGETSAIDSLTPGVKVEYTSPGVGSWTANPDGSCRYRGISLASDSKGELSRTSDIRGTVTATRDTLSGPLTIKVTHPKLPGRLIKTTATGTRITP